MSRKDKKTKDQTKEDIVQDAMGISSIPLKVPLGGGRYAELTEWNGSKRIDLRFWESETVPTKNGVSLNFCQWKILCNATEVVDDLFRRIRDGEPVDYRYHLGDDVYVILKAPYPTIHVRKHFVPEGEWTLQPTKRGVTLSWFEWQELKKTIPLFEEREPELKTLIPM